MADQSVETDRRARRSKLAALLTIDGRSGEPRLLRAIRRELTAHVGGKPSAVQLHLIEQAAQIKLRLASMDRKFAEAGETTDHDRRQYLAWANSFTRLMRALGLKGAAEKPPSLADYLATRSTDSSGAPRPSPAPGPSPSGPAVGGAAPDAPDAGPLGALSDAPREADPAVPA